MSVSQLPPYRGYPPHLPQRVDKRPLNTKRYQHLGLAAGMLGTGLLLRKVPSTPSTFKYVSTDIKDWIRVALGIGIVRQVNKGLDIQPSPWVNTLETLAVMTPLSLGFTRQMLPHLGLMAVLLPPLVQGTRWINEKLEATLAKNPKLPGWVHQALQLVMFGTSIALGVLVYPKIFGGAAKVLGKNPPMDKAATSNAIIGVEGGLCGCCSTAVCMTELANVSSSILGTLGNKFEAKTKKNPHPLSPHTMTIRFGRGNHDAHVDSVDDCKQDLKKNRNFLTAIPRWIAEFAKSIVNLFRFIFSEKSPEPKNHNHHHDHDAHCDHPDHQH